ncbi:MAG: hypothetical protein P8Z81_00475 [Deinococcales bacterium]
MADEQTMASVSRTTSMPGIGNEAVATVGSAGAVLAIVGLAGVLPHLLAQIGVIVVGASFVAVQGSAAARYGAALPREERSQLHALPIGGAVTSEFVGGMTAALLGLLSLLGVAPLMLLAIAVILLGAVEIATSRSTGRVTHMLIEAADVSPRVKVLALESAGASLGAVLFIGIGAVALGILAIVLSTSTLPLVLAATLALGLGILIETATRSEHAMAG